MIFFKKKISFFLFFLKKIITFATENGDVEMLAESELFSLKKHYKIKKLSLFLT